MEEIEVKKEEPETIAMAGCKEQRSWRKQQQDESHDLRSSLPANIGTSGKKSALAATHISSNSSALHHRSVQHYRTPVVGPKKQRSVAASPSNSAYSLGARCGEIFVANNAKQWTFVCTFCNKSTRDIGDFICHIKIKHLEESDEPPEQYDNDYYDDEADDDDNTCSQAQDVSNYFRHNRRAIEIIPINNHEGPPRNSLKLSTPSKEKTRVQRTSSEYLDCGNYLDINVHTEPEELNYSNGDKYGGKYGQQYQPISSRNKVNANNWKAAKDHKQEQPQSQQLQNFKQKKQEQKRPNVPNVVQHLEDSDNDIEDMLQTHTSHRKHTKLLQRQQQQQRLRQLQHQQQKLYRNTENARPRNGTNDISFDKTMDVDDEDAPADYVPQNNDDFADDDFDNQLLLAPAIESVDSSTPGSDGKVKRRQIRGTAYCALCNKTFQYYSLYRNHMIKHSNETPFKCNLCQKGFKSKQAIRYHMNTHQREAKFKCEICDTGFYAENQFIAHMLTHENDHTYPCMVCGKVMRSDKERDVHLAAHTEERPFRCEFCHKLFRLRHHLSNHLKMHRQYRCEYCKEEFTSAVHLRKPYACPVCENSPEARLAAENLSQHVNPMQLFEAVMPPTQPTECVDLAEMVSDSDGQEDDGKVGDGEEDGDAQECEREQQDEDEDDEEMDESFTLGAKSNKKKAFPCKHCTCAYSQLSGLNFHIRTKHS